MKQPMTIKRALLSVSDKTGIVAFAKQLQQLNIEILSTGGTAKLLQQAQIPVTEVADYTGFPEIMGGRVKTLHPKIHGGLLHRPGQDDAVLAEHGIHAIDLLVVNLYPFEKTTADPSCNLNTAIENIDIGGPTMIRAAAKNYQAVTVVVDPNDYANIAEQLTTQQSKTDEAQRFYLAQKAFAHTASYDSHIANYLGCRDEKGGSLSAFPKSLHLAFENGKPLRYGENPHQQAAFYQDRHKQAGNITSAEQLQGKALSFNNIADSDTALECVKSFTDSAACVIVKHANPCGVACASTPKAAYERAFATDTTSAFGGIIAFNQTVDQATAEQIIANQFVEVVIAPAFSNEACQLFAKKANVRLLAISPWQTQAVPQTHYQRVHGGLLVQEQDQLLLNEKELRVVSARQPSEQELTDCLFAWKVAKFVKSNAIVYAKDFATVGVGAGQMSRVDSAIIAGLKATEANLVVEGSVMASDAFFPFRDAIDTAASNGVTAIIQPGGSIRDEEVIKAADEHGISMLLTGLRHFRH